MIDVGRGVLKGATGIVSKPVEGEGEREMSSRRKP